MIGIDAVDVERFRAVMARTSGTERRLFTAREQSYCRGHADPVLHYAGTLAAKEAVIKAANLGTLAAWGRKIEVQRDASGAPCVTVEGPVTQRFAISISHDGPVAVAVAVAQGAARNGSPREVVQDHGHQLRPNEQLRNYIRGPAIGRPWDVRHSVHGTDFP